MLGVIPAVCVHRVPAEREERWGSLVTVLQDAGGPFVTSQQPPIPVRTAGRSRQLRLGLHITSSIFLSSNMCSLCSCSRCVHGICVPKGQSYSCQCNEGYQGQYCDRRQEPSACRGHRCGRGECHVSEGGEPVCHCPPGYTGPTCDTGNTEAT